MPGRRETLVFVHGYNNTFSDAVYRFAQIRTDFGVTAPGVVYSWPSAGDPRGYAYDRDSVLYSRDAFEDVLDQLTAGPGSAFCCWRIPWAPSWSWKRCDRPRCAVTGALLDRVNGVVLMSPDIDPDVFRRQAAPSASCRSPS